MRSSLLFWDDYDMSDVSVLPGTLAVRNLFEDADADYGFLELTFRY